MYTQRIYTPTKSQIPVLGYFSPSCECEAILKNLHAPFLCFLTFLECGGAEIYQFHSLELNKNRFVEIQYLRSVDTLHLR